jgi:hypothetical protein
MVSGDNPPRATRTARVLDVITAAGLIVSTAAILFGVVRWSADRNSQEAILRYQFDALHGELASVNTDIAAHLHAQDGRMDADERDARDLGTRVTRLETQLEGIRAASTVPLSSRR